MIESEPHGAGAQKSGLGLRAQGLGFRIYWVAVKELKLSYHDGYI